MILNEVVVAKDGEEALAKLFSSAPPPQLVLLDLKLPKVDGLEVLRRIRKDEKLRMLPVVILTSSPGRERPHRRILLGGRRFVQKPVDFEQFLEASRQLSLYWLVLNVAPPVK